MKKTSMNLQGIIMSEKKKTLEMITFSNEDNLVTSAAWYGEST